MITGIRTYTNFNDYRRGQSFRASASFVDKSANKVFERIDTNSADFIKYAYKRTRSMCHFPFEINIESGRLLDIVNSDEPHIFILNHTTKQTKDINGALFFNSLLYREYLYNNKAQTCPRSKIFASDSFMKHSKIQDELKYLGVVPVYSRANDKLAKDKNKSAIQQIVEDIVAGKINFFIFPDGAMAILPFLPMKYKFQPGVSAIIKRVLDKRNSIKVVPLAFAHDKKGSAIHIGKTVEFKKEGEKYFTNQGNSESEFFNKNFKKFYEGKDNILITNKGETVTPNDIVPFISGVLSENLSCCIKEAKQDLKQSNGKVYLV